MHLMNKDQLIAAIRALCQRYAHAGCEPGTHALAAKVLKMIEEAEGEEADA